VTGADRRPAVVARGLRLERGSRLALGDSDLDLPSGCVTALIGPNGSGKSTLLDAIAGLIRPAAGTLEVAACDDPHGIAYVLQATGPGPALPISVREVVAMGRYALRGMFGRLTADDRAAVDAAIDRMELGPLAHRPLAELSGGERQRAIVAQGLAQQAPLLLLDEPVTGLDIVSRERILAAVDDERAAGHTVVISTHDLGDAAGAQCVVLLAGRVVAQGPPDDVITDELLGLAYGGRMLRTAQGQVFFDDAHHAH
jgi:ABC-type Mn2+/Zn2+ transport system ATPase subunit